MQESSESHRSKKKKLAAILMATFFFAMAMGAGPGVYLVNEKGPILGMPAVYAWVVFWFAVQATTVIIAFRTVWKKR